MPQSHCEQEVTCCVSLATSVHWALNATEINKEMTGIFKFLEDLPYFPMEMNCTV